MNPLSRLDKRTLLIFYRVSTNCNSFTGMDNYREHKREMIDLLKTHPQPLQIYSQFEEMMSEIPGGLELVNRLDK